MQTYPLEKTKAIFTYLGHAFVIIVICGLVIF